MSLDFTPPRADDPVLVISDLPRLHRLDLVLGRDRAVVTVSGEVDALAAPALARVFDSLAILMLPIHLDLSEVSFIDSSGLEPVLAAMRERTRRGFPPIHIDARSRAVNRLLDACGFQNALLDLRAWDRLHSGPPADTPSGRRLN